VQFTSALRSLLAKCEYDKRIRDELLRNRFVAGCTSDKIRERLMLEPDDITTEQALVIAGNVERASKKSRQVHSQLDDAAVATISQGRRSFQGSSVLRSRCCCSCGADDHLSSDKHCPARGRKCKSCGKTGNFMVCCKKGKVTGGKYRQRSASCTRSTVGSATSVVEYVDVPVKAVVGKLTGEAVYVQCKVAGQSITLLMDTSAQASILNEATVSRLHLEVHKEDIRLKAYDGTPIATLGTTEVPVLCGDRCVAKFTFVVVEQGSNVMGKNLFDQLGFKVDIPTALLLTKDSLSATVEQAEVVQQQRQHSLQFKRSFTMLFGKPTEILGFQHRPKVNATVPPKTQAYWRVPLALQVEVAAELERMIAEGVLEHIDASEWVSNMVIARKSSGGVRVYCNLVDVNRAIIADCYPLPTMDDLGRVFSSMQFFSKLDVRGAYLM
jgi:hypothetical protein